MEKGEGEHERLTQHVIIDFIYQKATRDHACLRYLGT